MECKNGKYIETRFYCKRCGENDMSPNQVGESIKGWKCNICGNVSYPIKDKMFQALMA